MKSSLLITVVIHVSSNELFSITFGREKILVHWRHCYLDWIWERTHSAGFVLIGTMSSSFSRFTSMCDYGQIDPNCFPQGLVKNHLIVKNWIIFFCMNTTNSRHLIGKKKAEHDDEGRKRVHRWCWRTFLEYIPNALFIIGLLAFKRRISDVSNKCLLDAHVMKQKAHI